MTSDPHHDLVCRGVAEGLLVVAVCLLRGMMR